MTHSEFQLLKQDYESQALSAKKYCEARGIAYHTWAYWSRKAKDQEMHAGAFMRVLPEATSGSFTATVESPSGWRVHVTATLPEILAALPA